MDLAVAYVCIVYTEYKRPLSCASSSCLSMLHPPSSLPSLRTACVVARTRLNLHSQHISTKAMAVGKIASPPAHAQSNGVGKMTTVPLSTPKPVQDPSSWPNDIGVSSSIFQLYLR